MQYIILSGVIILVIFITFFLKKKVSSYPEVLLFGPANSGKTKLFYMVLKN